jgi:hypothetical protein
MLITEAAIGLVLIISFYFILFYFDVQLFFSFVIHSPFFCLVGYFTSRPLLKSISRAAHGILRNADFLFSLVKAEFGMSSMDAWENLNHLRAPEAVVQHHDGVSGTFRRLVGEDYLKLLFGGMTSGNAVISEMLGQFVANNAFNPSLTSDVNYLSGELSKGNTVPVVVFNSLPWARKYYMNVTIYTTDVTVSDLQGNQVNYQVNKNVSCFFFCFFFLFFFVFVFVFVFSLFFFVLLVLAIYLI